MDEGSTHTAEAAPSPPDGQKPRRRRRTREEMEAARAAEAAALPPFDPTLTNGNIVAKAERTVRTGQYESFTISTLVNFERDPRFSVEECVQALNGVVKREVTRIAEEIRRQIEVEK